MSNRGKLIRLLELRAQGGPNAGDIARVQRYIPDFVERGNDLFFSGGKTGATAERFEQLVEAIAVLAFCPGGITIFDHHHEGLQSGKSQDENRS